MILSAQSIRRRCAGPEPLLSPFTERYATDAGTSAGISPAGYDLRLVLGEGYHNRTLLPGDFLLAATMERFVMPRDLIGRVCDKSTLARKGLSVFNTVIEPGWRGYLTLELVNKGPYPVYLEYGMGIAQVLFETLDEPTEEPYPEGAKYQDQPYGPVGAKS